MLLVVMVRLAREIQRRHWHLKQLFAIISNAAYAAYGIYSTDQVLMDVRMHLGSRPSRPHAK